MPLQAAFSEKYSSSKTQPGIPLLNSENLTIVVDGGASGCRLGAYDNNGVQCAMAQAGPASLSLGEEQAWHHISQGLSSLAGQIDESSNWLPKRLWMGLAGALQENRRKRFLSLLPQAIDPMVITDGYAQLLGATGGQPGICLALGTGSVIHWLDVKGNCATAGGWGYPVGDEASGAWLGTQLINHYIWHRDTPSVGAQSSNLFSALEHRIGTNISDIQSWTTNSNSTEMASLAPIVVAFANRGDTLANTIVSDGTRYCQQLIELAPAQLPLFIVGGLAELYASSLKDLYGDRCQQAMGNALDGLYTYATDQQRPNS